MADTIKGITIEIGGNTEPLNKALSEVNKESRSIQNELKAVEKLLKLDPSNTELVAQKQQLLADAVNTAKSKIDALKQAQEEVNKKVASGEIDKGSEEYRSFERQVIAAEQALQQAEKAQSDYADECENAGKDAKEAGEQSEKAGKKAQESGEKAKEGGNGWEKFGELAKTAGKVAVAGITTIATGAAATGAAIWDMAQDTAAATDEIDKQSQVIGLSRKAYQEYDYILSQNGMDIAALSGVSKTLTAQMDKVTEGNAAATANFEKMGLSVYDSTGKLKSQEQMLAESITALQGMEDGTEKARLATELFGKQGQTLMPLLNGEAGSVEELRQKAHELGMVLEDEAVNAGVKFTDSLDTLNRTASGLKISFTANLLPGLMQLTTGFTELLTGSENAKDTISSGVKSIADSIKSAFPIAQNAIKVGLSSLAEIAPELISVLISTLLSVLPELVSIALSMIETLVSTLLSPENIEKLIDSALQIVVSIAEGIGTALPNLIPAVVQAIITICEKLTEPGTLSMLLDAVLLIILGLVTGIIDAIPMIINALPKIINNVIEFLTKPENIKKILQAALQLLGAIVSAIPEIAKSLIQSFPQILTSIKNGLGNLGNFFKDLGGNLIKGLWNGISDAGAWLWDKISGFFGGVVDKIKGFFGIHSPSTLFRDMIGKNLVKGIEVGVDVETPNLQENLEDNLSAATEGLKASVEAEEMKLNVAAAEAQVGGGSLLGDFSLRIDTFINNTEKDIQQITEEFMYSAEEYIKRKGGAFA